MFNLIAFLLPRPLSVLYLQLFGVDYIICKVPSALSFVETTLDFVIRSQYFCFVNSFTVEMKPPWFSKPSVTVAWDIQCTEIVPYWMIY